MAKIYCDGIGVPEHRGVWRASADEPATANGLCPRCAGSARSEYLFGIRVDDAESIGAERRDGRVAGVNLGLPGVFVDRGDGRKDYRPAHSSEFNNNAKCREHARRNGLTPVDSGRYRSR